jgi:hypothetical protein
MKLKLVTTNHSESTCSVRLFDPDKEAANNNSSHARKGSRSPSPGGTASGFVPAPFPDPNATTTNNIDSNNNNSSTTVTVDSNNAENSSVSATPTLAVMLQHPHNHVHTLLVARQADKVRLLRHFGQVVEKIQRIERFTNDNNAANSSTNLSMMNTYAQSKQQIEISTNNNLSNASPLSTSSVKPQQHFLRRRKVSPTHEDKQSRSNCGSEHSPDSSSTALTEQPSSQNNNNNDSTTTQQPSTNARASNANATPIGRRHRRRSFALGSINAKHVRCNHCARPLEADEARTSDGPYKYHVACYRSMMACGDMNAISITVPVTLPYPTENLRAAAKEERSVSEEALESVATEAREASDSLRESVEDGGTTLIRMKVRPVRKRSASLTHWAVSPRHSMEGVDDGVEQQASSTRRPNQPLPMSSPTDAKMQPAQPQAQTTFFVPNQQHQETATTASSLMSLANNLFLVDYETGSQKFLITPDSCLTIASVMEKICVKCAFDRDSFRVLDGDHVAIEDYSLALAQVRRMRMGMEVNSSLFLSFLLAFGF